MHQEHVAHDHKADARAAFIGLIGGALALLVIVYSIVQLTARKFEGHTTAPASTSAPAAPH